jgi:RNA polymerase sigma-70 factor, ECF subfamily
MKLPNETVWVTTTTILHDLRDQQNDRVWNRFVRHFRSPIEGFVRRIGVQPGDLEDVTQNTLLAFAEAYRKGKYERGRGRLREWLFGIAYRQALMQRRHNARHEEREVMIEEERAAEEVWEELWDRYLLEKSITQARSEFTGITYQAFHLVVLEDLAPPDAAARLGVPVKQVYNAKHRVLSRVRALLTELEEFET